MLQLVTAVAFSILGLTDSLECAEEKEERKIKKNICFSQESSCELMAKDNRIFPLWWTLSHGL